MSNIKLGELPWEGDGQPERDAVHCAVMRVVAGEDLQPGAHIGFLPDGYVVAANSVAARFETIGVADPFLRETIQRGEEFWMLLYPGTIQNLRHHWDHPKVTAQEVAMRLENQPKAEPFDDDPDGCKEMGCNE